MTIDKSIILTEEDVNTAIMNYIKDKLKPNEEVVDMIYLTCIRGSYERGNAEEYIKKLTIKINEQ